MALKSDAAAEQPKDQLSRDFLGCSIFDFCKISTLSRHRHFGECPLYAAKVACGSFETRRPVEPAGEEGKIPVLAHLSCVNSKGHLRDLPLRIHGSVSDASAERSVADSGGRKRN